MATTAASPTDRPHAPPSATSTPGASGTAEGNGGMKDLLGGKGAGLAEMTIAGLPTPPGFTITTEACNDYFAAGEQLPDGPLGRRPRGDARGRAAIGQGLRRRREPAPRQRPLGRQVLDARDDGHRPQPRAERGDAPGADRPDRQRALRLGRVPPVHPDVRADRHGRRRPSASTSRSRPRKEAHGARRQDTDLDVDDLQGARRRVQGDRPRRHRPRLPDRPVRAARPRDQGRLRVVVRQARPRLPREPEDRPRPRAPRSTS